RIAAARHVGTDGVDRDVSVAKHDAGLKLDIEVCERLALALGERADLCLSAGDVLLQILGKRRSCGLYFVGADAEARRVPTVELARVAPDRLGTFALDRGEHLRDCLFDGVTRLSRRLLSPLQVLDHGSHDHSSHETTQTSTPALEAARAAAGAQRAR